MKMKKLTLGVALSGMVTAGLLMATTGSAFASGSNVYQGTYSSSSACQQAASEATQSVGNLNGNYFYCSQAGSNYNLWEYEA